ncbi:alpha/beta hydrolase [Peribacillus simplex]|uniref:alpha/beta fold hydrolase n=1 Tax=Peribacillus simplex TaxID=1478 RepID=UPI00298E9A73|nr:alpha/beta hydrolase [Peribacillus simplex]MDW7615966.1 alpha/beta hydrolase [Peribacillus simplex]
MALHYQEYGDKSAIFTCGGVSSWIWEYFTHYHCIVPDLPEHGLSNYEINFSIKGSAEEGIKLIEEKASGKKVILIGFSHSHVNEEYRIFA